MGLLDQVLGQVLGGATGGAGRAAPRGGALGGSGGPLGGAAGGLGGLLGGVKGPIALAILAMLANKHLGSGAGGYGSVLRDMMTGRGGGAGGFGGGAPSGGGGLLDGLGGLLGGGPGAGAATGGGGMGGLGGALGGGLLGGALGGGLNDLLGRFSQAGHGDAVESWIGSGANQHLSPHALEQALGSAEIDEMAQATGMGRDDFLHEMSDALPKVVDGLTPHGRLPTEDEATGWV